MEAFMEYNRKAHSVYLLTYHIVFVTKYRKPVITNEIGEFMKNLARYLYNRFGVVKRGAVLLPGRSKEIFVGRCSFRE